MPPTIVFTRDPGAFAAEALDYLSARPERNLLATILIGAQQGAFGDAPALFALITAPDGKPVAAMMRTPPMPALATGLDHGSLTSDSGPLALEPDSLAGELVGRWLEQDPDLPGILGEPAIARAVARAWSARTGGTTSIGVRQAMHALEVVTDPPRPAGGQLRTAEASDRTVLLDWEHAFLAEAHAGPRIEIERRVDRRIANGWASIWEDGGEPVCFVGCNAAVAGTQRIGPVYTPPEHRNRGYATSATAETSRRLLAAGARRCMLFTDLANPTSNAIYASIGYRRFADCEEHAFIPAVT